MDNELHWQNLFKHVDNQSFTHRALANHFKLQNDTNSFLSVYAYKYFSVVSNCLKKYDPGQLYLGCRFVSRIFDKQLIATAGAFCDVVSVNIYNADPDVATQWHKFSGKPILIGEFHFQLHSERQVKPLYPTFTTATRINLTSNYLKKCRSMPFVVGTHWNQFADQPLTGRVGNGEH
mgnify:CR=1 FL=1